MKIVLQLENVGHQYQDGQQRRIIFKNINYQFEQGKFYSILGHSGSGKTTLLSLLAGLDKVQSGKILFNEKDINQIGLSNYRRNYCSIIFQQYNLITYMSAVENVIFVMDETDNKIPKNKKEVAYQLLEKLGIGKSKANRLVTKLSGGEQQRVAIARALASNVQLIFADEPTGNLDTATQMEVIKIFRSLARDFGKTIIIVTHSSMVAKYSELQLLLERGVLREEVK